MDKVIKLSMNDQKDIIISITDSEDYIIRNNNRLLSAKSIYDLLKYSEGDSYSYEEIAAEGKDKLVLLKVKDLLKSITDEIVKISITVQDNDLEEKINDFD